MKLVIATPDAVVASYEDVASIRAEDESGEFGILPRHADFLTALSVSVVGWRHMDGRQRYCAVRGGLLTVSGGREVAIATREAIPGDDLAALEAIVRGKLAKEAEEERQARAHAGDLRIQAIRQIISYLRPQAAEAGGDRP
jgi:F-type H+-transporting ATPase subunit epsilon